MKPPWLGRLGKVLLVRIVKNGGITWRVPLIWTRSVFSDYKIFFFFFSLAFQ